MKMEKEAYKNYFINSDDKDKILSLFDMVCKIGTDFKLGRGKNKVINFRDQNEIMKDFFESIPDDGKSIEEVLDEFNKKVLDGSVNFSSPRFLAFPDSGNSTATIVAHILAGFLNQNLINSIHTSPTATFVEIECINWLREIVGYKVIKKPKTIIDVGGISVTGGTLANIIGLVLARENKLPGTMHNGLGVNSSRLKVFIPKGIGHYSIRAGLGWTGLGINNIVEVETTNKFTLDQKDLVNKIVSEKNNGNIPLCLIAYTGDSRTMAIDDFPSLSKISKKYGLWFHVDACHGLSLCFSENLRRKIEGIELADSVTVDPHKVLFSPYALSFILVKDPRKFELVSDISDLITKENYSFGQITPFLGSKPFNSLKLWFLIKNMGKKNIGKMIEQRHEFAKLFSKMIEDEPNLYLLNEPTINSVVYIYVPSEVVNELKDSGDKRIIKKLNLLNKNIQVEMFKRGEFYVHTFLLNDFKNVLKTGTDTILQMQRVMFGNPLTSEDDLKNLILHTKEIAHSEWSKIR